MLGLLRDPAGLFGGEADGEEGGEDVVSTRVMLLSSESAEDEVCEGFRSIGGGRALGRVGVASTSASTGFTGGAGRGREFEGSSFSSL